MVSRKFITLLILVVVLPKVTLSQCQQATPIRLDLFTRV